MSTYYYFYVGYIDNKTNKVHPMGPFDDYGKLKEIFYRTGSSISNMVDAFESVNFDDIDEKYQEKFSNPSWNDENKRTSTLRMQYIDQLPSSDFIKSGYFLVKDVNEFLKDKENNTYDFDGFYEKVDPILYAEMVKKEIMFGKPKPEKDEEGYEIPVYSASDYMWFSYPDYWCEEYESFMCKNAYHILYDSFDFGEYGDYKDRDITPVILCVIN